MQKLKLSFFSVVLISVPFLLNAQLFVTDVIVQGSICVGIDCVNGESFGFDTQRYKENNLRIHFDDTSNSGSFPANDWRITLNDSDNGGANYFGIDDATAGNRPFQIDAGAGANALKVDASGGNIGMGTADPVVELHITDGDSPTMRLEQNGASGWTPQTWDVAGNETNFFVRDVTNGSKLPFKIKPGALDNSIYINASGNVTMGGTENEEKLFVKGNISTNAALHFNPNGTDLFKFLVNAGPSFALQDAQTGNNVIVVNEGAAENTIFIHDSGAVSIGSNTENGKMYIDGGLVVNGDIRALSDRRIKTDIKDIQYGLDEVLQLSAKEYNFDQEGSYDLNLSDRVQLGLIAQEVQKVMPEVVHDDVNAKSKNGEVATLKGINYTALIPVLIKALQEQHQLIEEKDVQLAQLRSEMDQINAKLDALFAQNATTNEVPNAEIIDSDAKNQGGLKKTNPSQNGATEVLNNGRSSDSIRKHKKESNEKN